MALNYIEVKLRNRKEIVEYLKRKEFNNKCIDYALEKLDKLNRILYWDIDLSLLENDKYLSVFNIQ